LKLSPFLSENRNGHHGVIRSVGGEGETAEERIQVSITDSDFGNPEKVMRLKYH
jgi:hypothetical protein